MVIAPSRWTRQTANRQHLDWLDGLFCKRFRSSRPQGRPNNLRRPSQNLTSKNGPPGWHIYLYLYDRQLSQLTSPKRPARPHDDLLSATLRQSGPRNRPRWQRHQAYLRRVRRASRDDAQGETDADGGDLYERIRRPRLGPLIVQIAHRSGVVRQFDRDARGQCDRNGDRQRPPAHQVHLRTFLDRQTRKIDPMGQIRSSNTKPGRLVAGV